MEQCAFRTTVCVEIEMLLEHDWMLWLFIRIYHMYDNGFTVFM